MRLTDTEILEELDHELKKIQAMVLIIPLPFAGNITRLAWLWEQHKNAYLELRALYRKATRRK